MNRFLFLLVLLLCLLLVFGCSDGDGDPVDGDSSDGDSTDGDSVDGDTTDGDAEALTEILGQSVDEQYTVEGLSGNVAVAFDESGIPHIYAETELDAALAMGYVQADQRMFEMEFLRKFARGRLTDLVGAIQALIDQDLFFRMIFSTRNGEDVLQAIYDNLTPRLKGVIDAYAEGVNRRLARYKEDDSDWPEPFTFMFVNQKPSQTNDWEPLDTISIARYQTWLLSQTLSDELNLTEFYTALGPDLFNQLIFPQPLAPVAIIPDWNTASKKRSVFHTAPAAIAPDKAAFLQQLKNGKAFVENASRMEIVARKGASNSWALNDKNGVTYLCNDPHLSLQSPAVFMPVSVDIREMGGESDGWHTAGVAFPGTPSLVIGRNDRMAWGETTSMFDVLDLYLETVTFDGNGKPVSVSYNGNTVDVIEVVHQFRDGHNQTPPTYKEAPLYFVPHHGPLVPETFDTVNGTAISFSWTGQEATGELECFMDLQTAGTMDDAFAAAQKFEVGAQNHLFATVDHDIGVFPHANLPLRTGDLTAHPPWLVQPGDTDTYSWNGFVPEAELPSQRNPASGYIITANNDPTGSVLDNDPLNDDQYYLFEAAVGYRALGVKHGLEDDILGKDYDWEDLAALQFRVYSEWAADCVPPVLAAMATRSTLSDKAQQGLAMLQGWDYQMASGIVDPSDPIGSAAVSDADELASAASATYFNFFMVRFEKELLFDELQQKGLSGLPSSFGVKATVTALRSIGSAGGESVFFDDVTTDAVTETAEDILARSLEMAVDDVFSHPTFAGLTSLSDALWGRVHTLTMENPLGSAGMTSDFDAGPFGLQGGPYTVNVGSYGVGMNPETESYGWSHGASMRMVHELTDDGITTWFHLPGGTDERMDSEHFLDLHEMWMNNDRIELSIDWEKVKQIGIERMIALTP